MVNDRMHHKFVTSNMSRLVAFLVQKQYRISNFLLIEAPLKSFIDGAACVN